MHQHQHCVQILRTPEEIETVRNFWNDCNPGRDADLDFYLFFAALRSEARRPHVVVLYDADTPKALLAGRLEDARLSIKLGYLSLPGPSMRLLQFVHGGWLGETSNTNAKLLIGSVLDSLKTGEAEGAVFHYAEVNSALFRSAKTLPRWYCSDYAVSHQIHRFRDVSNRTEVLSSLTKKHRYNFRSLARKLKDTFPDSRIDKLSKLDELDRLVADAEKVVSKSYQRGLGVGFSATPIVRSRLEFEARKGWLRAYILYLNGQPSAFWIGSLRHGVFVSDYLAFDPAYAKYGPGLYLIVQVIEELGRDPIGAPIKQIDFGIGDALYKARLSNRERQEAVICIFAPTAKALAINALRSGLGTMIQAARTAMGPLADRIKRLWRMKVTEKS
ncbi:hypothetical protein ABIG06_005480 [Bradyrhizobium sp. USDA 326]|uniref:GNAT family N-acetyltransferase n=1 Tax=unclassified Bradyrhizobium TaxID=2631580 RepID=UPI00351351F1